jgi:hypothetical protein
MIAWTVVGCLEPLPEASWTSAKRQLATSWRLRVSQQCAEQNQDTFQPPGPCDPIASKLYLKLLKRNINGLERSPISWIHHPVF